jgi:hypothetical protein
MAHLFRFGFCRHSALAISGSLLSKVVEAGGLMLGHPIVNPVVAVFVAPRYVQSTLAVPLDPFDRSRRPGWRQQSKLLEGRVVFWLDTDTYFTLRQDQYAYGNPEHLVLSTSVTRIIYDPPLESSLFEVIVPPGYRLLETG